MPGSCHCVKRKGRMEWNGGMSRVFKNEIRQTVSGVKAQAKVASISRSASGSIQLIVKDSDLDQVRDITGMTLDEVGRNISGTFDAKYSMNDPRRGVKIRLDRGKKERLEVSGSDIRSSWHIAFMRNDDSKLHDRTVDFDIHAGIDNFESNRVGDVSRLTIAILQDKLSRLISGVITLVMIPIVNLIWSFFILKEKPC